MRLFTGISLAPPVTDRLSAVMQELRPCATIRWSPLGNLHITSKFIGDWPDGRVGDLKESLDQVISAGPIGITVSRFGFLPNPHRPTALVVGVHAAAELAELAKAISGALEPLGCKPETRPYLPHVTLARIRPKTDVVALRERIADMTDVDFGAFEATQFHLYNSTPGPQNSVYTILASYDLMVEKQSAE